MIFLKNSFASILKIFPVLDVQVAVANLYLLLITSSSPNI